MTTIAVTPILKSRHSVTGAEVTTLLCRYPRMIHSEIMTHRALSRNSASSRAIPVAKLIQSILDDPMVPLYWGKNQKGMQAGEEHNDKVSIYQHSAQLSAGVMRAKREFVDKADAWQTAMLNAIHVAKAFDKAGYHKQIVNRLIEPFMHITVLITATEWDNFDQLRIHPAAEPHFQMLARKMKEARESMLTQVLEPGQWHLPFADQREESTIENSIMLSVARCASTSYKTVDDFDMTPERAALIFNQLNGPPLHASPMEHVCQADEWLAYAGNGQDHYKAPEMHRNFRGFRQYRAMVEGQSTGSSK